jgi:hypothetical protein
MLSIPCYSRYSYNHNKQQSISAPQECRISMSQKATLSTLSLIIRSSSTVQLFIGISNLTSSLLLTPCPRTKLCVLANRSTKSWLRQFSQTNMCRLLDAMVYRVLKYTAEQVSKCTVPGAFQDMCCCVGSESEDSFLGYIKPLLI